MLSRAAAGSSRVLRRWMEYCAFRAVLFTLRSLPPALAPKLGRIYISVLDRMIPRLRKTAYRNLTAALPGRDAKQITDGVFSSLARMLVAFARFPDFHPGNIREYI